MNPLIFGQFRVGRRAGMGARGTLLKNCSSARNVLDITYAIYLLCVYLI
jgi:hypothetical protein